MHRLELSPSLPLSFLGLALLALSGCDGGTACVRGSTQTCRCAASSEGVQTCGGDGTFGACTCEGIDGGPAGRDAASPPGTDAGVGTDTDAGPTGPCAWPPMEIRSRGIPAFVGADQLLLLDDTEVLRFRCDDGSPETLPGIDGLRKIHIPGRLSDGRLVVELRTGFALVGTDGLLESTVEIAEPIHGEMSLQVDEEDRIWWVTEDPEGADCPGAGPPAQQVVAYDPSGTRVTRIQSTVFCDPGSGSLQVARGRAFWMEHETPFHHVYELDPEGSDDGALRETATIADMPSSPAGTTAVQNPLHNAGHGALLRFQHREWYPVVRGLSLWDPDSGERVFSRNIPLTDQYNSRTDLFQFAESDGHYYAHLSTSPREFALERVATGGEAILVFQRSNGALTGVLPSNGPRTYESQVFAVDSAGNVAYMRADDIDIIRPLLVLYDPEGERIVTR